MKTCEHNERPSVARCVACGTVLCYDCRLLKKGRNFCYDCAPGKPAGFRSPNFSMLLSLIPGLGQFYTGSLTKGLIFLMGAGASVAFLPEIPAVFPLLLWFVSIWDARMSAHKRNFRVTKGRSGSAGVTEGDWMLLIGTLGLTTLFVGLPWVAGVTMEPWALWVSFFVVLALSALLGRGGKNVKQA